jgi:hypothetical protein
MSGWVFKRKDSSVDPENEEQAMKRTFGRSYA